MVNHERIRVAASRQSAADQSSNDGGALPRHRYAPSMRSFRYLSTIVAQERWILRTTAEVSRYGTRRAKKEPILFKTPGMTTR